MTVRLAALAAAALAVLPLRAAAAATPSDKLLREHLWREVRRMPAAERPKVGLVLSAGAVRGLAHIGVIRVLEDAGFPIDVVAGTSMGAVVGALYAGGLDKDGLWEFGSTLRIDTGNNMSRVRLLQLILADKLLSSAKTERRLKAVIGDVRFDQLRKAFACVAMDIRTGEKIIFRDGPVAPAVRASTNLPGIFQPVLYPHRYLVDGGVVDYVPVDVAKLLGAEWVLASVTEGDFSRTSPTNVLMTLEQVIDIRGSLLSRQQRKVADIVIEPEVGEYEFYQIEKSGEVMGKGVEAAKKRVEEAKESLILFTLPRLIRRWSPQ
jgi:NTE family protein